ncbi:hypothetical protein [Streptomyces iconiensis]|uniref:Uncharacterized protein n=1 Tax=Streptomyces iconiensis TaxID=1384038 RepID=A0ABT7A169_9ACTN|nr:hypothetical protein [Streptomyces iconiensis]MDJ1135080.1 hypothetical protein [Streptomyces iconiensis]
MQQNLDEVTAESDVPRRGQADQRGLPPGADIGQNRPDDRAAREFGEIDDQVAPDLGMLIGQRQQRQDAVLIQWQSARFHLDLPGTVADVLPQQAGKPVTRQPRGDVAGKTRVSDDLELKRGVRRGVLTFGR